MPIARRDLLRSLLALPALAPATAFAGFRPPDAAARTAAIGALDGLTPALRAAFTPGPDDAPIPRPGPSDWLAEHDEDGQSFFQWRRRAYPKPTATRRGLAVLPVGALVGPGMPDLAVVCDFAARFFGLPIHKLAAIEMRELGARGRKRGSGRQYRTGDILAALKPRVPDDAYCLVAVTAADLYPGSTWNFVFGEATFAERVGVYSFARYDPAFYGEARGPDAQTLILRRALKLMAHEVGHMFGIWHCTFFHCVMNGSNSLQETDRSPLHLCPVCLRKLHHAVAFDPIQREISLAAFLRVRGLTDDADRSERRALAIAAAIAESAP